MDLFESVAVWNGSYSVTFKYQEKTLTFPQVSVKINDLCFDVGQPYQFITDGKKFVTSITKDDHSTIVVFEDDDAGEMRVRSSHYLTNEEDGAAVMLALFPQEAPEPKRLTLPVNGEEDAYLDLLRHVLVNGERRYDRTGVGTWAVFAPPKLKFSLRDGRFPLLTTKRLHTRSIFEELFWFLRGETNNNSLREKNVTIWDEWAKEDGELGPVYGYQWRKWPKLEKLSNMPGDDVYISRSTVDQIEELVTGLITNPAGRRHIISAWNPGMMHDMALPPCHILSQYYADNDGGLHCQLYQRSADLFLGVPFNIASYALLTNLIAVKCGLKAASLTIDFGDAHIYTNHYEQVRLQTSREPRDFPRISIRGDRDTLWLDHLTLDDVSVEGYDPLPAIPAPVAK